MLDLVVWRYPERTRSDLYAALLCGEVLVDGQRCHDPKVSVPAEAAIEMCPRRYVSRGGEKLEVGLRTWDFDPTGKIMLDVGASTGGFTDCLLTVGAASVHAIDVGNGQLDYRLQRDPRVICHFRTNIMQVSRLAPVPDLAVCDLSFRSVVGAAAHVLRLTRERRLIALVKPQFEWRNPPADFRGVVRSDTALRSILWEVTRRLETEDAIMRQILPSPIRGRRGNREFLFLIDGSAAHNDDAEGMIDEAIATSRRLSESVASDG